VAFLATSAACLAECGLSAGTNISRAVQEVSIRGAVLADAGGAVVVKRRRRRPSSRTCQDVVDDQGFHAR